MKVGLTGASGLLGTAVAEALRAAGHEVMAIRHHRDLPPSCTQVQGTLCDVNALTRAWEGVTAVIHLAAIFTGSEEELRRTNVEGTAAVARASERLGAKLVMAGSAMVYAPGKMIEGDESFPRSPVDAYGWSKFMAEERLPSGACVLRLPSLISAEPCTMRDMLCGLVTSMCLPRPGDGGVPIELAPVKDVAQAVLLAVDHPNAQGPFNVSGARRPRFVDIIEAAASAWGVEPNWSSSDQVEPGILQQATEERTLSLRRAEDELGYRPREDWREVLFAGI